MPAPSPPFMALRTYGFLRIGMLAVLFTLGISVLVEIVRSDGCVQRSISAYYYTPTQSVFVGALVALGVCMIALWGKFPTEDASLNLAGLLAPVVAFVPTSDANYCSIVLSNGTNLDDQVTESGKGSKAAQARTDRLIEGNHDAVFNNVVTLLVIIALVLVIVAVAAAVLKDDTSNWAKGRNFWAAYGTAVALWALGLYLFTQERPWFYAHAHAWSAIFLFVFIMVVVFANAVDGSPEASDSFEWGWPWDGKPGWRWRATYAILGALMVLDALVVWALGASGDDTSWVGEHWVFLIELTLIILFCAFWLLQGYQRRKMGAPPDEAVTEQAPSQAPPDTTPAGAPA